MDTGPDSQLVHAAVSAIRDAHRSEIGAEFLRKKLSVSLSRAIRLVDELMQRGVLGPKRPDSATHLVLGLELPTAPTAVSSESGSVAAPVAEPPPPSAAPLIPAAAGKRPPEQAAADPRRPGTPRSEFELPLDSVRIRADAQIRTRLSDRTVEAYAQSMQDGVRFPPIDVFLDNGVHVVADGHHRLAAARKAGRTSIRARLLEGDAREAMLHALSANGIHGIPLTRRERRDAVVRLLRDPEWSEWSNEEIARRCGLSAMSVSRIRRGHDSNKVRVGARVYKGRDGRVRTMNVSRIGRRRGAKVTRKSAAQRGAPDGPLTRPLGALQKLVDSLLSSPQAMATHVMTHAADAERIRHALSELLRQLDTAVGHAGSGPRSAA